MAAPRGSFSPPFTRIEPSRVPKEAVLPIGSHVILRPPTGGADRVTLTAEDGTTALGAVKVGAEVEITAWRPRRSGPALYRVRARIGGKEGWTAASSLERLPPAPSPTRTTAVPASSPAAKRPVAKTAKRTRSGARVR
jgi:hypothetical protein